MKVTVAWWDLSKSKQTIESLRQYLTNEGVEPWESVDGLRVKYWISNSEKNLWGAVTVWNSMEAMTQSLPPNRAAEIIGYPPTSRISFDIEARVENILQNLVNPSFMS